jgi:regulator of cell morphogenesis and NO signaling
VGNPIRQMEAEHESAGEALAQIRKVTSGYSLPDDACPTFRALYEELERMEEDLHQHIHLENNILFPRAIAAEPDQRSDAGK